MNVRSQKIPLKIPLFSNIKTKKNIKSTKSKFQIQKFSKKSSIKYNLISSNFYQSNPIQFNSKQPIAKYKESFPDSVNYFSPETCFDNIECHQTKCYGIFCCFNNMTLICIIMYSLHYYAFYTFASILIQLYQYYNVLQPSLSYNNVPFSCYAVNVWKILHDTNQNILKQDKAFLAKEKLDIDNQSYFLPFVNGTPILLVEIYSNSLLAMIDSGCTKNLLSTAAI